MLPLHQNHLIVLQATITLATPHQNFPLALLLPLNRAHLTAKHAPLCLHGADPTGDIRIERRDDGIPRDVLIPVELRVRARDVRVQSVVLEPGM